MMCLRFRLLLLDWLLAARVFAVRLFVAWFFDVSFSVIDVFFAFFLALTRIVFAV